MMSKLDTALSTLINDLQSTGLLSQTLIVLATEFGRTPTINDNAGRDHHPGVFSGLLCGAGIQGGSVYGTSDAKGGSPDVDAVGVEDFNATIAKAMACRSRKSSLRPTAGPSKSATPANRSPSCWRSVERQSPAVPGREHSQATRQKLSDEKCFGYGWPDIFPIFLHSNLRGSI